MSIDEFFSKYNNQYVEVSGSTAKWQCVDLANAYIRDVLGQPIIQYTNAEDFPNKIKSYGTWVKNTPTGIPPKGAIVVWDYSTNEWGHIAIATGKGTTSTFESFDQNYPTGSKCHFVTHNYNSVIGWLIPTIKESTMPIPRYSTPDGRCWIKTWEGQAIYIPSPEIAVANIGPDWSKNIIKVNSVEEIGWQAIRSCPPNDCSAIQSVLDQEVEKLRLCEVDKTNLTEELKEVKANYETLQKNPQTITKVEIKEVNGVNQSSVQDIVRELINRLLKWARKDK